MTCPSTRLTRGATASGTALALVLLLSPAALRAWPSPPVPADTVVAPVAGLSPTAPVVVVDPLDGEPHLGFTSGGAVRHAWRSGGTWSQEVVVTTGTSVDLAVSPAGLLHAAYGRAGGVVACARRVAGAWTEDTAAVVPGTLQQLALAIDPATGEPVIAFVHAVTADSAVLRLARRGPGGWSVALVDTGGANSLPALSLALDAAGRPRLAWSRRATTGPQGLLLLSGAGPLGPFASEVVDTAATWYSALALDPTSGAPRLASIAEHWDDASQSTQQLLLYAWRHATLGWVLQPLHVFASIPRPVSLALDPLGDPVVATTVFNPLAPFRVVPDGVAACGFIETGEVHVWTRLGGEGPQDFALTGALFAATSALASRRAVAAPAVGVVEAAWREPHYNSSECPPTVYAYGLTRSVDVPGPSPAAVALGLPAPNPLSRGGALTLSFALSRAAVATFDLHDVAGRRVGRLDTGRLAAGTHTRAWAPGPLAPGLYWLTLRLDGARVASRGIVVVP